MGPRSRLEVIGPSETAKSFKDTQTGLSAKSRERPFSLSEDDNWDGQEDDWTDDEWGDEEGWGEEEDW
jgi:hypothetical protein